MKQDSTATAKRTTVAVTPDFAKKLSELASDRGLSIADYCDKHLGGKVTADWRAMLARKLKTNNPTKAEG